MINSIFRSKLKDLPRLRRLLNKISDLHAEKASRLVIQVEDSRFSAKDLEQVAITAAGDEDNIVMQRAPFADVAASLEIQDLTYTAVAADAAGNAVSIEYVDGGTAGSEVVNVTSNAIQVEIDDGVSTAQEILDAIEASLPASALVSVALTGTDVAQDAVAETNLAGGVSESEVEYYDLADIQAIKRLRTKKYLIKIKYNSDSEQA